MHHVLDRQQWRCQRNGKFARPVTIPNQTWRLYIPEVVRSSEDSEGLLVLAAKGGNISAFDELARRYRQAVWLVARQHVGSTELAHDVTQDALLIAFKALPTLSDEARFGPWLRAIARNRALRVRSEEARSVPTEVSGFDQLLLRHSRHIGAPQERVEDSWIHDEIALLPEIYRQAVQLYYFEDWPIERIASFYGQPITTLKWRLHAARKLLKDRMNQAENEDHVNE